MHVVLSVEYSINTSRVCFFSSSSLSLSHSVAEIKRINPAQAKRSVHLLNLLLPVLWCSSRVFDFLGNNKSCPSPASLCSCIHLSIFVPVLFAVS